MTVSIISLLFPLLLAVAAIGDFLSYRIPNWLTLVMALAMPPVALVAGMPLDIFVMHLAAGALMLLIGFFIFTMGWAGGGDAKMVAAAALWVGWEQLVPFLVVVTLAGGVLAIAMKLWQALQVHNQVHEGPWLKAVFAKSLQLPYGIAIAAGGMFIYPHTWWLMSLV